MSAPRLDVVGPLVEGPLGLGPVRQIAMVTDDLDRAIRGYDAVDPTLSWRIYEFGPSRLSWQRIGGRAAEFGLRCASAGQSPQVEFVQPLAGDTSLARVLAASGPGALHHLAVGVDSFDQAARMLSGHGFAELEAGGGTGLDGDGAFGYFDTRAWLGVYLELLEYPARAPEPVEVRPAYRAEVPVPVDARGLSLGGPQSPVR
jgi:methylmalonyl-CoA/ethylmalonyl-CoA epimerase